MKVKSGKNVTRFHYAKLACPEPLLSGRSGLDPVAGSPAEAQRNPGICGNFITRYRLSLLISQGSQSTHGKHKDYFLCVPRVLCEIQVLPRITLRFIRATDSYNLSLVTCNLTTYQGSSLPV